MLFFLPQNVELLKGLPTNQPAPMNPIFSTQPAQSQYIDQAITPTGKFQTADQVSQQLNGANYQNFRDNFPNPTPSPREFNMQGQIYEQKLIYDDAQKKMARATNDQERGRFQKVMDDAATSANLLRQNAQNLGWDTTGFNADNSLGEAVQRMNLNRNRGAYELLDLPSTSAQMRSYYQQLRDRGVSPGLARATAEEMHDEFREANIQRLMEGINSYGLNPDGSINEFGQMLAHKLYGESPYAEKFVGGYALPKDAHNVNSQVAIQTSAQNAAMARQLAQLQSAENIANNNLGLQKDRLQLDINKFYSDQDYRNAVLQQNEAERISKTPEGVFNGWLKFYKLTNPDAKDEEIFELASTAANLQLFGKGKDTSKQQEDAMLFKNGIDRRLTQVQNAIDNGNVEKAHELLTGIETEINDLKFKDLGVLSNDDVIYLSEQISLWRDVADGKITKEEAERRLKGESSKPPETESTQENNSPPPEETKMTEEQRRMAENLMQQYLQRGSATVQNPEQRENPSVVYDPNNEFFNREVTHGGWTGDIGYRGGRW